MRRALFPLLFALSLFGIDEGFWQAYKEVELYKDEIFHTSLEIEGREYDMEFRWTLFKNEGLICHLKYDRIVHQFILYNEYQLDRFTLSLAASRSNRWEKEPYMIIRFKDYRRDSRRATLEFFIRDGRGLVDRAQESFDE